MHALPLPRRELQRPAGKCVPTGARQMAQPRKTGPRWAPHQRHLRRASEVTRRFRHDHEKFFSTRPADNIHRAHILAQAVRDLLQDLVTGIMAIGVVHGFEVVDIEHANE